MNAIRRVHITVGHTLLVGRHSVLTARHAIHDNRRLSRVWNHIVCVEWPLPGQVRSRISMYCPCRQYRGYRRNLQRLSLRIWPLRGRAGVLQPSAKRVVSRSAAHEAHVTTAEKPPSRLISAAESDTNGELSTGSTAGAAGGA